MLRDGCVEACRGCAHRGLTAAESEARKAAWLRQRLAPWAGRLAPVRAVDEAGRWGYRDRVCLSAAWDGGAWRIGLRSRDTVVDIPGCPVHTARTRAAVRLLAGALPPGPAFPMVYVVQAGAQLTLVLKTAEMPPLGWLDDAFGAALACAGIEGLWLHLHSSAGYRVFGRRGWHLAWGRPRSRDEHGFVYGPAAFQQLLPGLFAEALDEAEAFLAPQPGDAVADLYCGNGASMARWRARGAAVMGVELGGEAVACAQENAPGAVVLRGTCAHRVPQLAAWSAGHAGGARLLYLNPPRTGVEPGVLAWIATDFRPARVAYLSCSAGTLHRDLSALAPDYDVARLTPYDFFPQTLHVETLALLARRGRA